MKKHFKLLHLFMALVMLMTYLTIPSAIADDTVTVTLNVTNTPVRGDVVLEKKGLQLVRFQNETDANGYSIMKPVYENGYLAGAKFELHAAENIVGREGTTFYTKDQLIETLTTTSTGSVKSSLLPLGKYYLVEVSAPDGYVYSTERCNFTLSAIDKKTAVVEVKVSASNTYLPVRVSLEKKKEQTRIDNLDNGMVHQVIEVVAGEGFVFGLYNSSVIKYANNQQLPADTLMATAKTDKNGKLTISGQYPHGNYYLKELAVPDGWKLSAQKFPVVLTSANKASNENVIVVKLAEPVLNELIYIPVTITKTDITGAETIPGALIEVYDENRTLIYREYTNKDGKISDIPVVPGNYTFKETYAPEGYALNVSIMDFTVTKDGKVTGRTSIKDEVNHVELLKTRENGDPLEGCVFGLFNEKGAKIMEATSGADGIVQFKKIPYGKYTIKEISAPYGFHASKNTWKLNVDGTYINPIKVLDTVVNEDAPGWIKVRKIDELDGHAIAGVQFDIFAVKEDGTTGDLVSTMVTNEDGIATSEDLLVGDYLVKEHENPVGYKVELWSEKITVIMDKTIERTVKNMPLQGKIKIVKTDGETEKGLPGAVFTVTRVSGLPSHNGEDVGEIVAVLTTDENGLAETPLLTWGEYKVAETHVPDDYIDDGYSNQSHYRTQQDREADLELERQSMSLPEMARALGIDRNDAYHLADTVRDLIIIKVAGKRRVLTDSFEKWYSNQSTFKKLEDRSEAEIRQIQMKTRDQILKRKIAESLQGVKLTKGRYTIKEAAKIFKISESAVQRMIRSGGLKAVRLKNTWYIVHDDIEYLRTLNSTRMQREEDQNGFVD